MSNEHQRGVEVKPLEWDGIHAKSIIGEYSIGAIGGEWKALMNDRQIASGLSLTHDGAKLDAKAAAQAHYDATILSALTPSPLPQVVRLLRSLEAIAEDFIPDRDEDAPLALQEMRDAIRAVIAATEALDNG
ncbi:hypothetical protein AB9E14_23380 [Rhizobium leguminosarum]|uniref:hypothetical protein n=1 Tax=Rhizobium leguminosarum TaxID=384 RepID=UPI003F9E6FAC